MGHSITTTATEKQNLSGSLREGQILHADLCDSQGGLLLRAGLPVTSELIRQLAEQGIREVYLDDHRRTAKRGSDSGLVAPYSPLTERQLAENYERITLALADFCSDLVAERSTSTDELEAVVTNYLQVTVQDAGVVLAAFMRLDSAEVNSHDEQLQRRSVRMAMLAIVTATQMQLSEQDCLAAGVIGAIHDISLYGRNCSPYDQEYFEHPMRSAAMLQNAYGLSDRMRLIVEQVHEQCDGSGYPRSLKAARLHPVGRLLNIVDAYLTLIEPLEVGEPGYAPSDALSYLIQQTLYGYFDRECLRALLAQCSIYPVGTKVSLDDGSSATVLRGTGPTYLQPVVRFDSNPNSIIDLRYSDRVIVTPAESDTRFRRLPKSALQEILWRPAA